MSLPTYKESYFPVLSELKLRAWVNSNDSYSQCIPMHCVSYYLFSRKKNYLCNAHTDDNIGNALIFKILNVKKSM